MRLVVLLMSTLSVFATGSAHADPILECRVLTGEDIAVDDCLRTQLEVSYTALTEAQERARATARQLDDETDTETALRGVEASQHAWEAYRDVECQTLAVFVAGALPAGTAQLACEIRLTRARIDTLLRFAGHRGS